MAARLGIRDALKATLAIKRRYGFKTGSARLTFWNNSIRKQCRRTTEIKPVLVHVRVLQKLEEQEPRDFP